MSTQTFNTHDEYHRPQVVVLAEDMATLLDHTSSPEDLARAKARVREALATAAH